MASPITVPITTPIILANKENKRYVIRFQNSGANPVYVTKQSSNGSIATPSATVYDFIVHPLSAELPDGGVVEVQTTAQFNGVAVGGASTLAIMKTFLVR